jgi:hypothetical protein
MNTIITIIELLIGMVLINLTELRPCHLRFGVADEENF